MGARVKRRQLLLASTMLVGLTGYGGRAYGQVVCNADPAPPNFTCTGASTDPQTVNNDNATVVTVAPFSVNAIGIALTITGDGALSYTDYAASPLTGTLGGLFINATGDIGGGNQGSITVYTNGALTAGAGIGLDAFNEGSGALNVTANGDVIGNGGVAGLAGIRARNYGTDLSVTTGPSANGVYGGIIGILALNYGNGVLSVTAKGDVEGGINNGIYALNYGTNLEVTTGAGTLVTGDDSGISARNAGRGAVIITANGDVTGDAADGINALNGGTDLTITTGAGTMVTGDDFGIRANNQGSGALNIIADGDVTGDANDGISAINTFSSTDITVITGPSTNGVTGGNDGINVYNFGTGALEITANGDVTGNARRGIFAQNSFLATDLTVTTSAGSTVYGAQIGIYTRNYGTGALTITANGNVTGGLYTGILALNPLGTDLSVTTGAGSTVVGNTYGISANNGRGVLSVTVNGNVTGNTLHGIYARNAFSATDLTVTTGTGSTVYGAQVGIYARNLGTGALTITANGDVVGNTANGIYARNTNGTRLTVTTGAGSNVVGGNDGINADNSGAGALSIVVDGNVIGEDDGIDAEHSAGGPIAITVGVPGTVESDGANANDFAIETTDGPTNLIVAGVLNGGDGGMNAVRFDQVNLLNDRLELRPTATINGIVFAGPGTDTLAFGGPGQGNFNLADIGGAQQYRNFEAGEVAGGLWTFTGATALPFTVNAGVFGGTPTVGGLTVNNGGTVGPGASIGTITVNGAFTLNAGAIFEVEVNAQSQGDQVIVNGMVNLTGSVLRVLAQSGNYRLRTDYVIVDNDGNDAVQGRFAQVATNLAFLTPLVDYAGGDGNDVVLTLVNTTSNFSSVAQTRNQRNVARALDQFPTDDPLFLAVLFQTADGARQAFDALSGEIHATLPGVLADDSRYVREAILGRLIQANYTNDLGHVASLGAAGPQVAALDSSAMALGYDGKATGAPTPLPLAFWTRAYGAWGDFDGDGNAATADRDLGGFVSGMDAQLSGSWRVGLATGASFSNIDVDARASTADVESFLLAGYAGGMAGAFALRGGGTWAWSDIDTNRAVIFPGFFERQTARYDADTGQLFGEVAYPTQVIGIALEPFAGLAYVSIDAGTIRERGGALASLRGSAEDQDVGYSTVGLRAAHTMHWGAMPVTPHVSAAWQHAFDTVTPGAALAFASTGIGFTVFGVPLAEDTALIDAGLDFALGPNTTAGVSYSGQFGDGVSDNAVKGRFTWAF